MIDLFNSPETRWAVALVAAGMVSAAAYMFGALTSSGLAAATVTGTVIVATAGWWPGAILVTFFVTASGLSLANATRAASSQARGKRRDAVQVFANGGVPAVLAAVSAVVDHPGSWLVAMVAAVAGATSDTFGTEIGRLSRSTPFLVTTWKPAPPGTSGAISVPGTIGALGGALLIGATAGVGYPLGWNVPSVTAIQLIAFATIAGFLGSLLDSILGATLQASYWCPACQVSTEQLRHRCGTTTVLRKGHPLMNNDFVNLLSIVGSAVAGFVLASIWL
jgi:uncharacterized protein (TIGR00297 family)